MGPKQNWSWSFPECHCSINTVTRGPCERTSASAVPDRPGRDVATITIRACPVRHEEINHQCSNSAFLSPGRWRGFRHRRHG